MISTDIAVWLYALLAIGYYTQLVKDNIWYQFCEHTFIAVAAAHGMVVAYESLNSSTIQPLIQGNLIMVIPLILGVLVLSRLIKGYTYLSNWSLAIMLGVSIALSARGAIRTQILTPILATAKLATIGSPLNMIKNFVYILCVFSVLVYFIFTIKPVKGMSTISQLGRYFMMLGFGTSHAYQWLSRTSSLISQFQVFIWQWLGLG